MNVESEEIPEVVGEVLGDHAQAIASAMADVIAAAHAANPNGWELTLEKSGKHLRLNAGAILLIQVERDWTTLEFAVDLSNDSGLLPELVVSEPFKILPEVGLADVEDSDVARVWPEIRDNCLRAAAMAASKRKRVTWYWAHSQEAVDALAEVAGRSLPEPDYVKLLGSEPLEELYAQFLEDFASQAKGANHVAIVTKSRISAREKLENLRALEAANEDLEDAVLDGLLPHSNTAHNAQRGAWISVAPAVTKDIRSWFEGSGFRKPEDWPMVAEALWRLVSKAVDVPETLAAAIEEFQASDWSKGFQAGMISPFLNAVAPASFAIFNSKSRKALNHFAGTAFSANLSSYPDANRKILEWTAEQAHLFAIEEYPELRPHEAFDMFAHWLVAERKFFKAKREGGEDDEDSEAQRRVWKIAAGQGASHWQEWQQQGYAAMGPNELGDLTGVSRSEFEGRVSTLIEANPGKYGWSKAGLEQNWRFLSLRPGDAILVNRGTKEVIGIGEVVGSYQFDPGGPLGHRVPVKWVDSTVRAVSKPGWKRTLIEISEEDLEEILQSGDGEESAQEPLFAPRAFELLRLLRDAPTKETYQSHKDELQKLIEEPLRALFREAVARLPGAMLSVLETEKRVFSRFLKNDYGQGGAWPWLWAAAYPKRTKRIDGAQMYIFVEAERVDMGFYIEESSNEIRSRLTMNLERFGQDLKEPLLGFWSGHPFDYGHRVADAGAAFGFEGSAWFDRVSQPDGAKGNPIRVGWTWRPEEVTGLGRGALADAVAKTWTALFPLELMSIREDPRAEILEFVRARTEVVGERPQVPVRTAPERRPVVPLAEIAAEVRIPEDRLDAWIRALERKGQAILYGPPGTGKTFIARKLAGHLVGGSDGFIDLLQFHPSYAYEDFIQGLRPVSGDGGTVRFEVIEGRFLEFCRKAEARTGRCVLILDEINRANLSRVFGELMYLLEYRGESVALAGGRALTIPANVRILGTMNTADRSIALVDHALRRRFAFLSLQPEYDVLRGHFQSLGLSAERLIALLKRLNSEIGDANYAVGVSFFLVEDPRSTIEHVWRMEIEPYIEELFFDQPLKRDKFRWNEIEKELVAE